MKRRLCITKADEFGNVMVLFFLLNFLFASPLYIFTSLYIFSVRFLLASGDEFGDNTYWRAGEGTRMVEHAGRFSDDGSSGTCCRLGAWDDGPNIGSVDGSFEGNSFSVEGDGMGRKLEGFRLN